MSPPDRGVLVVIGPTASGKSALALVLAGRLDAELVSMDSRQVYRGMDVGTAKPSLVDRARARHHGLDLLDPDERYSAGRFARDARRWIRDIRGRGRLPLLVGGTGLFLRALTDPIFREPPVDPARRRRLRERLAGWSSAKLGAWVRVLDPARAETAAEGGAHRLVRTLEVALLSGRPLSWWHEHGEPEASPIRAMIFLLVLPRDELDRRIEVRCGRMVQEGLVEEVRGLMKAGYGPEAPGMTGTGYREMAAHVRGDIGLEEATKKMILRTRQYARRQLTWFRSQLPEGVRALDATASLEEQARAVEAAWG